MRVSASKYGLLRHCQHWAKEGSKWFSEESEAAIAGTEVHKKVEDDILARSNETGAARWLATLGGEVFVEQAFGLDPSTATASIIEVEGRDYPKGLLCGRADAVVRVGKNVIIVDWKSGMVRRYHRDQCELLCAVAMAAYGADEGVYAPAYIDLDGNLRFEPVPTVLTKAAAEQCIQEACSLVQQIEVSEPWPGAHCAEQYCPHAAYCKAGDKVTTKAIEADLEISNINAADMLVLVHLLKERVKRAESELKGIARSNGGIVVDGRKWSERIGETRVLDQKRAVELAKAAGAKDEDLYKTVTRSQGFRW